MTGSFEELLTAAASAGPKRIAVAAANDAQTITACVDGAKRAVVERGGLLRPLAGGTYQVTDSMCDDVLNGQEDPLSLMNTLPEYVTRQAKSAVDLSHRIV